MVNLTRAIAEAVTKAAKSAFRATEITFLY
jgi:hypothetical protein